MDTTCFLKYEIRTGISRCVDAKFKTWETSEINKAFLQVQSIYATGFDKKHMLFSVVLFEVLIKSVLNKKAEPFLSILL